MEKFIQSLVEFYNKRIFVKLFTHIQIEPDETAFVRFTPNSVLSDSDYANEIYNPPISPDDDPTPYVIPKGEYIQFYVAVIYCIDQSKRNSA